MYVRTLAVYVTTIIWGRGVKSRGVLTTALVMVIVLMASVVAIADIKVITVFILISAQCAFQNDLKLKTNYRSNKGLLGIKTTNILQKLPHQNTMS